MIERNGETYLETLEAQAYVGNRSYTWLAGRVDAGTINKYKFGESPKPYYKKSELDTLKYGRVAVLEQHEPVHPREELERMYTLPEMATALHVSRGYIWRLVDEGRIEAMNLGGGGRSADWRVSREEFERFKRERLGTKREKQKVS